MRWKTIASACCLAGSAAIGLAACGGSSGSNATGSFGSNTRSASAANVPAIPQHAGGKAMPSKRACVLVPVTAVEAFTGHDVRPDGVSDVDPHVCMWDYADSSDEEGLTLHIEPQSAGAASLEKSMRADGKAISGLGAAAYGQEDPNAIKSGDPGAVLLVDEGSWDLLFQETSKDASLGHLTTLASGVA